MKQHNLAAQQIAEYLEKHPKIARVHYPGLASHPQHELAKKQMSGYGAVISFELKGGYAAGEKMVNSIKIFSLAVSLGGVESLIEHPASMTHSELSEEDQLKAGISPGLIRISVGLEDVNDLMEALENALATI
jgi:methionine-gamma-lyase